MVQKFAAEVAKVVWSKFFHLLWKMRMVWFAKVIVGEE